MFGKIKRFGEHLHSKFNKIFNHAHNVNHFIHNKVFKNYRKVQKFIKDNPVLDATAKIAMDSTGTRPIYDTVDMAVGIGEKLHKVGNMAKEVKDLADNKKFSQLKKKTVDMLKHPNAKKAFNFTKKHIFPIVKKKLKL